VIQLDGPDKGRGKCAEAFSAFSYRAGRLFLQCWAMVSGPGETGPGDAVRAQAWSFGWGRRRRPWRRQEYFRRGGCSWRPGVDADRLREPTRIYQGRGAGGQIHGSVRARRGKKPSELARVLPRFFYSATAGKFRPAGQMAEGHDSNWKGRERFHGRRKGGITPADSRESPRD